MKGWLAPALLSLGCSAPFCAELDSGVVSTAARTTVASETVTGSARFVDSGQALSAGFRAKLSGLPEVTEPGGSVQQGLARLAVNLQYEQEPLGNDGRTQMPQLALGLAFEHEQAAVFGNTPMFPQQGSAGASRSLFQLCAEGQTVGCCPRGVTECEHALRLRIERLDGEPFPPVVVDWSLRVSARVSDCPGDGNAVLVLDEIGEGEP